METTTLDIYLNTAAQNIPLSENDTAVCDFISSLSYFTAGDAIYIAAGLIGKEIHPSNTSGMKHAQPVTINQKKENVTDYSIMPNPVTSSFVITGNVDNISEVFLMNYEGKVLKQFKPLQLKYTVTDIANGMYWLKLIESSGKVSVIKLSIIK
jgi:hypothetical protein